VVTKYLLAKIRGIFISHYKKFANETHTILRKRNFAIFDEISHLSRKSVLFSENLANYRIVLDVTPVFQFNTSFMKHRNGHAAWSLTCNIDIDMHQGHGYGPWTWT
jgi:hypothetical protein